MFVDVCSGPRRSCRVEFVQRWRGHRPSMDEASFWAGCAQPVCGAPNTCKKATGSIGAAGAASERGRPGAGTTKSTRVQIQRGRGTLRSSNIVLAQRLWPRRKGVAKARLWASRLIKGSKDGDARGDNGASVPTIGCVARRRWTYFDVAAETCACAVALPTQLSLRSVPQVQQRPHRCDDMYSRCQS